MLRMPGKSFSGPLPALTQDEAALSSRLRAHVEAIGSREHNVKHYEALEAAARYVERTFQEIGYDTTSQVYEVDGKSVRNIEATLRGRTTPGQIILVGAHYDSVAGAPGANDNASGVAGMLEIARAMRDCAPARTVRFVAFVNEEPPYFQTEQMGSLVYARMCKARGDEIVGMITPETIGYYSDAPGSQKYPFPFNLFYPDTGNFVAFVGNRDSRELVGRVVASFRAHTPFPSEGAAAPGSIEGVGWSDHWSFWQAGYPALMVTDTAPFRYPYYHERTDTPDKIDYDRMARVVAGLRRVVEELGSDDQSPCSLK